MKKYDKDDTSPVAEILKTRQEAIRKQVLQALAATFRSDAVPILKGKQRSLACCQSCGLYGQIFLLDVP
eukprot:6122572-Amphidinium_carterae.1